MWPEVLPESESEDSGKLLYKYLLHRIRIEDDPGGGAEAAEAAVGDLIHLHLLGA